MSTKGTKPITLDDILDNTRLAQGELGLIMVPFLEVLIAERNEIRNRLTELERTK